MVDPAKENGRKVCKRRQYIFKVISQKTAHRTRFSTMGIAAFQFASEEDECMDWGIDEGYNDSVIAWNTRENTTREVFCFLRDAETVGLDKTSWTDCEAMNLVTCGPPASLHSLFHNQDFSHSVQVILIIKFSQTHRAFKPYPLNDIISIDQS